MSRNSTLFKPVQNTWHQLIQPRSTSTWPILYSTSVNESPQRRTKFICGFRKCHNVCSNIWEVSFVTTLLILMPLTRKCFGWIICELLVLFHRGENKQAAEEIHSFPSLKLSKHQIVWKQHTTSLWTELGMIPKGTLSQKRSLHLQGELILPQI